MLTSAAKMQKMGPAVYHPVHSPQSFQDYECWSGLNPRCHARQSGALQHRQAVVEQPFRINENENRCYVRSSLNLAYK